MKGPPRRYRRQHRPSPAPTSTVITATKPNADTETDSSGRRVNKGSGRGPCRPTTHNVADWLSVSEMGGQVESARSTTPSSSDSDTARPCRRSCKRRAADKDRLPAGVGTQPSRRWLRFYRQFAGMWSLTEAGDDLVRIGEPDSPRELLEHVESRLPAMRRSRAAGQASANREPRPSAPAGDQPMPRRTGSSSSYARSGTSPGTGGPFGAALVTLVGRPTVGGWPMTSASGTGIC